MDCDDYRTKHSEYSRLPLRREVWDTPDWSAWMDHFHDCRPCSDWTLAQRIIERGFRPDGFPCVHVGNQVTTKCGEHPDPCDCPNILITYFPRFDEYSIAVRDGGTSAVAILYCPWCGVRLPESKRDRWFDELKKLGFDDPVTQEIPDEFLTDRWYKNPK